MADGKIPEDSAKKAGGVPDDFWSVESLVPSRRRTSDPAPRAQTVAGEIELPVPAGVQPEKNAGSNTLSEKIPPRPKDSTSDSHADKAGERSTVIKRYIPPHTASEENKNGTPELDYCPTASLVHRVRIYGWHTSYSYYEQFCTMARRLMDKTAPQTPHVPFFSYMPQYSQLTSAQLGFYLWLRSQIKSGIYPDADYSYILLLIYETINLSDIQDAKSGRDLLADIWMAYRQVYSRLDIQLSDWLCDYCLINRLEPPYEKLKPIRGELMRNATMREFYIECGENGAKSSAVLAEYCSNYDYRKSKFAVGDNLALYAKHMKGVISYVISHVSVNSKTLSLTGLQDSKMMRDAYTGALCSPRIKKHIEIEYCSFSRSHELRFLITDIMKYAENRIRASLGIKSRLSHGALPPEIREAADAYFNEALPARRYAAVPAEQLPEYEKLYEPRGSGLSLENAAQIEELSWETTGKLVEAFESEETGHETAGAPEVPAMPAIPAMGAVPEISEAAPVPDGGNDAGALTAVLDAAQNEFVRAALTADAAAQRAVAARLGRLPDITADEINGIAADIFGDIILEENGGVYTVIEDYADTVAEALGMPNTD